MLGRFVKVHVTYPINSYNKRFGFVYKLNYGIIEGGISMKNAVQSAYIMGINHPVRSFDGKVIASIKRRTGRGSVWVVAPKSTRFIINDIRRAIDFAESPDEYTIECLYESSCGAVVFNDNGSERKYLLIRNKRSAHWGFPKGHIEPDETPKQTAIREVYEETGIMVDLLPNFKEISKFTIQGKIEKDVIIFLAKTDKTDCTMQQEEIDEIGWFDFDNALNTLTYDNDKRILYSAQRYLNKA